MRQHIADMELLARMRTSDDAEAFRTLYDRYWKNMYRTCRRKIGSAEDACDILQDIFCRLWENRQELTIQSVDAYLFIALRNRIFNYYKHVYITEQSLYSLSSLQPKSDQGLNETLAGKDLEVEIRHGIAAMPGKMRHVFLLSRQEGLSNKNIAHRLSLSEQTVRNQIHKALQRLRRFLGA